MEDKAKKIILVTSAILVTLVLSTSLVPLKQNIMVSSQESPSLSTQSSPVYLNYTFISNGKVTQFNTRITLNTNGTVLDKTVEYGNLSKQVFMDVTGYYKLSDFTVPLPSETVQLASNQTVNGVKGIIRTTDSVTGTGYGLIKDARGSLSDRQAGINDHYEIILVTASGNSKAIIKEIQQNGTAYCFIPELALSHSHAILNTGTQSSSSLQTNGGDPELFLQQKDQSVTNLNVWHLGITLNVNSFSPFGNSWTSSINAQRDSINWAKLSSTLTNSSSHNTISSEVTTTGHAVFEGYFVYFWKATPTVTVSESFSFVDYGMIISGTINDPLYTTPFNLPIFVEYSDFSQTYYNFGDKTVIQYMI